MIKKSCRYYTQRFYHKDENGKPIPFEVEFKEGDTRYVYGGVGGNYPVDGVNFYVKVSGEFVRLK